MFFLNIFYFLVLNFIQYKYNKKINYIFNIRMNQNNGRNNNNRNRNNNPFNIEHPENEDISVTARMNRDIFVPITALSSSFGLESEYYSLANVDPLKESFFHILQSLIFPNSTITQITSILCYLIIILFIVILCFGIDSTNTSEFLPAKLSVVDKLGSYNPSIIKKNYLKELYRLLTFHFLHYNFPHLAYNVLSLITFCSLFEALVKKYIVVIIFFFSSILGNLTAGLTFQEKERSCGANAGIAGIQGAFCMLFIMNWDEMIPIFGQMGRFLTIYLLSVFIFISFCYFNFNQFVNVFVQIFGLIYGGLLFSIIAKPINIITWKKTARVISILLVILMVALSLLKIYFS